MDTKESEFKNYVAHHFNYGLIIVSSAMYILKTINSVNLVEDSHVASCFLKVVTNNLNYKVKTLKKHSFSKSTLFTCTSISK